jgi:hypothetical protein
VPQKPAPPSSDETSSVLLQPVDYQAWRSELSQELVDELVAAAMCGALKADAALSCGVPPDLFEAWLDEGMRYDAPPLLRQLSVRFLCSRKRLSVALSERLVQAALNGDNKLALELLERQNAHWSKDPDRKERENVAPEMALDVRRRLLVESFRNPRGEMRAAMLEAGLPVPDQSSKNSTSPES